MGHVGRCERTRLLVGLDAERRRLAGRAHVEGQRAGHELVQDARGGVHVDLLRGAQPRDVRQVAGEHLGRRIAQRGAAHRRVLRRERRAGSRIDVHRGAEVDEAQIERPLGILLGWREVRRAQHDVGRRDIAVHEAVAHQLETHEQVEQVAAETRRRKGREPPLVVHGQQTASLGEGDALDPLHHHGGAPIDQRVSVQAREAFETRDRAVALVFGTKSRSRRDQPSVAGPVLLAVDALGQQEHLERVLLAQRVRDARDHAQTAATRALIVREQRDEAAAICRALPLRHAVGLLELLQADAAHPHGKAAQGPGARDGPRRAARVLVDIQFAPALAHSTKLS